MISFRIHILLPIRYLVTNAFAANLASEIMGTRLDSIHAWLIEDSLFTANSIFCGIPGAAGHWLPCHPQTALSGDPNLAYGQGGRR